MKKLKRYETIQFVLYIHNKTIQKINQNTFFPQWSIKKKKKRILSYNLKKVTLCKDVRILKFQNETRSAPILVHVMFISSRLD